MGRKLRRLVGALKDKASLTKATLIPSPSSAAAADIAVLRATSHHRPSSPPHPRHIAALISFGNGARPAAAALSSSLSHRLLSTRDPSVALKSLLSLHHLLRAAPFILLDSLVSSLLPNPSGRFTRSPLLLSSFPLGSNPSSWTLSNVVRWYSSLLELRLIIPQHSSSSDSDDVNDWVSSLLTRDLIAEIEVLAKFFAEAVSPPAMPGGNGLVAEVRRVVDEDRDAAEDGILVRLREVRGREIGSLDAVELVFVLRRLDERRPSDEGSMGEDRWVGFWMEVKEVRGMAEEIAARVVRRERAGSFSDRFGLRVGEIATFGSNRWVQH